MKRKFALLSVYNKDGIIGFAQELIGLGFEIISSGGTAQCLKDAGLPVIDVASLVGGGAILGHRVVTLSREIHAGLLAKYGQDELEMARLNLNYIDLVCCDLYPLEQEIANPDHTVESVIEKTDIGGPTMLRSAAKGRRIVIGDSADRQKTIDWLKAGCPNKEEFITALAAKAEYIVANYCLASARFNSAGRHDGYLGQKVADCQYGENAYQAPAALYENCPDDPLGLAKFQMLSGLPLSYNNYCDLDRLLQTMTHIATTFKINRSKFPHIALGVKHGNACGAAVAGNPVMAIEKMVTGDPQALFGGLVMVNFPINLVEAELLLSYKSEQRRILDGVIAPAFKAEAVDLLKRKGDKCRCVVNPALGQLTWKSLDKQPLIRQVRGGYLKQPNYTFILELDDDDLRKSGTIFTGEERLRIEDDLLLAKAICDTSNSNTITIVKDGQLLANGVGQQSRVNGAKLAVTLGIENGHNLKDAVAASDSFFPFVDGPAILSSAGIKAIISTSGSIRDEKVVSFCQDNGLAIYLIPNAKGRGFFNH